MDKKIISPLGEIVVTMDGKETPCRIRRGVPDPWLSPNVCGYYRIEVPFTADGTQHRVTCRLKSDLSLRSFPNSGEGYLCREFYSEENEKLTIGMLDDDDAAVYYGHRAKRFESESFKQGVEYVFSPQSESTVCLFGVAWIDLSLPENPQGVALDNQTWFAADPTYPFIEE